MPRPSTVIRLADTASDQWGLITRQQAAAAGVSPATLARLSEQGGLIERVAHSVYRLVTAPVPDNLGLRAAWLQLAPNVPVWKRTALQGVVSHRSAAAAYRIGDLPADIHEFTLPERRQTRRRDVRLHTRRLTDNEWIELRGLPVTLPARIASDLLYNHEDPEAVARIITDAIRAVFDYPGSFADSLAPHAVRFGLRRNDGLALLRWFLDLTGDPERSQWLQEAQAHVARAADETADSRSEEEAAHARPRTMVESTELTVF